MSFQINDRLYWPEGKRKAFTLSYDDGIEQDRRLVRMMNERKVRGTFNLNSGLFGRKGRVAAGKKEVDHIKIPAEEIIRLYENHEVAGHGVNHESMYGMDTARCAEEILTCRKELEQITGRPLTGFAYAFGAVDENILNAVRLSGISYARTITSTYKFDIPLDFLQWNPTCHHDDERVMELADAFLSAAILAFSQRYITLPTVTNMSHSMAELTAGSAFSSSRVIQLSLCVLMVP